MNKTNLAALAAMMVVAAGLSACSSDDNTVPSNYPADNKVRVETTVSDMARRGLTTTASVTDQPMGLYIYNATSAAYCYNNVQLTHNGTAWTPARTMVWQNATQPVTLVAYAPYNAQVASKYLESESVPVSVQSVQTATDNSSDFLICKLTDFTPGSDLKNGAVPIAFKHALSRLDIIVKLGSEFDAEAGGLTASPIGALTVGGTKTQGACNFVGGGDVTVPADAQPQAVTTYEVPASFVPATGGEGHETSNPKATYSASCCRKRWARAPSP